VGAIGVTVVSTASNDGGMCLNTISNCFDTTLSETYLLVIMQQRITIVIANVQSQACKIDVLVSPDQERAKDRLGQEIKDTVEHSLGIGCDHVATLRHAPGDRVQDPQKGSEGAAHGEGALDVAAVGAGVNAGFPDKLVDDVAEGDAA
jgi:hypothetical protein